jgi:hypothetical protein
MEDDEKLVGVRLTKDIVGVSGTCLLLSLAFQVLAAVESAI